MTRVLTFSLSVLLTVPLLAAERPAPRFRSGSEAEIRQLPSEPGRVARWLAQAKAARSGDEPRASVVVNARSSDVVVFPAAGNVRGAGGELFRSDVTLINWDESADQRVAAVWLQNGIETDDPPTVVLDLSPNLYYHFTDFVGQTLGRTNQLGTILIIPLDAEGDADPLAAIDGFSRIWTNQPNATGTVAQPFEAVNPYTFESADGAAILGLRHDPQYRSNVGIVNLHEEPRRFEVFYFGRDGSTSEVITLGPFAMTHRGIPAGSYGPLAIEVFVDHVSAPWVAYGTSNDNVTGDGWVSIGSMIARP